MTNEQEFQQVTAILKRRFFCLYNNEVVNSSFVHLMKFSAKNPRLRVAANVSGNVLATTRLNTIDFIMLYPHKNGGE
ncbi:hypothetical protein [Ostreibacterium oceani]|uniref:Uncharacterized protein n=1 Tax=Ostreibacterium oceani TaxID=2654998 RepID=A0A6N7EXC3_9GAMM|nr:hypothetical protein [Ostreibacterium oceani]MPV85118.1 hypothetical protein [Ostreibacterium oceani]